MLDQRQSCLLHGLRHDAEALFYSDHSEDQQHPRVRLNLLADCQRHTLVPPLNSGVNAAPASVRALLFAMVGPETTDNVCHQVSYVG